MAIRVAKYLTGSVVIRVAGAVLLAGAVSLAPLAPAAADTEPGAGLGGHVSPQGHPGGSPQGHPGGAPQGGHPGGGAPQGHGGDPRGNFGGDPRGGPGRGGERYNFGGRDARHFEGRDRDMWRGGRWVREMHDGRMGWWWFAGGAWYYYDQPIYPYPPMVSDFVYGYPEEPMAPMMAPPPMAPPPMNLPPPAATRYYCNSPAGYYPQVQSCPAGFQPVTQ